VLRSEVVAWVTGDVVRVIFGDVFLGVIGGAVGGVMV